MPLRRQCVTALALSHCADNSPRRHCAVPIRCHGFIALADTIHWTAFTHNLLQPGVWIRLQQWHRAAAALGSECSSTRQLVLHTQPPSVDTRQHCCTHTALLHTHLRNLQVIFAAAQSQKVTSNLHIWSSHRVPRCMPGSIHGRSLTVSADRNTLSDSVQPTHCLNECR